MKKIFTLIVATMLAAVSYAQVNFTDHEGNVYENGSTMDIFPSLVIPEVPDFFQFEGPKLVNTSASAVNVMLEINVKQLPADTQFAECFSGACTNYGKEGVIKTKTQTLSGNATMDSACEWFYDETMTGFCVADYTLYVNGKKDKTITVRFLNGVSSVNAITADATKSTGIFTIDGKRAASDAKGLIIRNGKKILVK